jgi:hypothetical protein
MTRQGYRNEDGEIVETSHIINAVFQEQYKHGLFCNQQCQKYMLLLPISRDQKATHWDCLYWYR